MAFFAGCPEKRRLKDKPWLLPAVKNENKKGRYLQPFLFLLNPGLEIFSYDLELGVVGFTSAG
jgi:hypothetical protein